MLNANESVGCIVISYRKKTRTQKVNTMVEENEMGLGILSRSCQKEK
jgi:hypothetical protein